MKRSRAPEPAPAPPVEGAGRRTPDAAVAAGLVLLVLLTICVPWPLAGVPQNDDFSYARSALAVAQGGKSLYNGWGSPMLWPQLAYGALLIKAFGFSYTVLGASGIVLAALATATMYALARACGCAPLPSALATAALTLNPVFLGTAPSFLSDIPSLFLLLVALLALVRSLTPGSDGETGLDGWKFVFSVALGLVAGMNRQISWVAYLAALGTLAVLLPRERRRTLPALGVVLAVAAVLTGWFNRQPYTVPADVGEGLRILIGYTNVAFMFIYKFVNIMGLFALPLTLPALRGRWKPGLVPLALLLAACLIPVFFPFGTTLNLLGGDYRLTIYGQYFTSSGIVVGGVSGFERKPTLFPAALANALALAGAAGAAFLIFLVIDWFRSLRRRVAGSPQAPATTVAVSLVVAASVLQFVVFLSWFAQMNIFDRYLLFLLPGFLILFAAQAGRVRTPALGVTAALLAVMWLLAIGTTGEYRGYTRARATLYNALIRRGVPRTAIDGGVEMNAETQIAAQGYVNNRQIVTPAGAFREGVEARNVRYRPEMFPVIDAHYLLSTEAEPHPALVDPEPLLSTSYTSPLFPPRRRTMYAYRVRR